MSLSRSFPLLTNKIICTNQTIEQGNNFHHFTVIMIIIIKIIRLAIFLSAEQNAPKMCMWGGGGNNLCPLKFFPISEAYISTDCQFLALFLKEYNKQMTREGY
jgi:hypothetical protein